MSITRRLLIRSIIAVTGIGLFLRPLSLLAAWNEAAFSAVTEKEALEKFFPGEEISPSDAITIDAHDLVENGAYVPVQVESTLPEIQSITLLVEQNPNPLIASFEFSSVTIPFIATRIKIGEPSDVIVVVNSRGKLFSTRKFIEVVEGGCG